jgi:16S rRNA (guanine1516-N2)-methyltransferase
MPLLEKSEKYGKLRCSFTDGSVLHRFKFGGGRNQDLAKAVGFKGSKTLNIVDTTAGLGKDAFVLASLGARVTLIERSQHMYELLKGGIEEGLRNDNEISKVIKRMTLLFGDSRLLLKDLSPDVIMIDPMHPSRKKSALVNLEMRLIRKIVGDDLDYPEVLEIALGIAKNRVVLKLPRYSKTALSGIKASHQILGKSTRYDVFMINKSI